MNVASAHNGNAMKMTTKFPSVIYSITALALSVLALAPFGIAQSGTITEDAGTQQISSVVKMPPLNLDSLIKEMLVTSPELQAARKRWEAMQKRPGQAGALPDPTIRLGWTSAGVPYPGAGLGSESSANLGVAVSQMFPFPGKRDLKSSMAHQEARAESFMFQGTELNLVSRLKSAYYELQFSYDAIAVLSRDKELLDRLVKLAENRYSTGQASQQDLIKAQLEISLIETRLLEMERNRQRAVAEINSLLSRDLASELGHPEPAVIPELPVLESLQNTAAGSSPTLRAQRAIVDARQLGLEESRRDYYPDFEVMGGYFNQGSMKAMWEFRVQVNVPVFFARKQRLGVEEAVARLSESKDTYHAQELTISYRIRDQYLAAENSRRLMDLYQKLIIPQASLALESSLTSYSAGKVDFLSVFSNFSSILENEMKYYESRMQFLKALADLSELTGANVER
jgi:cobalt-zinc-cadmium efflux system outer membrane protein